MTGYSGVNNAGICTLMIRMSTYPDALNVGITINPITFNPVESGDQHA